MKINNSEKYNSAWLLGCSGGIGQEILNLLQDYALNICSCDIQKNNNSNNSSNNIYWQVNCSDDSQLKEFAKETVDMFGPPELMIIAAGVVSSSDLEEISSKEIDNIYSNNFKLVAMSLKTFFESCSKNKNIVKNIVVIGSNASLEPRPNQPVYAAMKSAINSIVQSQALAWGKYNIKINVLAPGTVAVKRNLASLKKKYKDFPLDPSRPLGKIAFPNELNSTLNLLLDKNLLMTGQILIIDGGSNLS